MVLTSGIYNVEFLLSRAFSNGMGMGGSGSAVSDWPKLDVVYFTSLHFTHARSLLSLPLIFTFHLLVISSASTEIANRCVIYHPQRTDSYSRTSHIHLCTS